ncbi:unnamed protein product [Rangifer tarandus platyrhynchus]|uniref:Uncharacterized protein n=2 Tax=Rangifer tarandus platyrhynchus TaxID=3082113 RepID=A0ACB0EDS2_RANTA|nr:unnamed protein product [Rangifer tarandus platyrhynchus]CAI9698446.1 unnamed protein product [Rangifer tarandus platyrhynchus]
MPPARGALRPRRPEASIRAGLRQVFRAPGTTAPAHSRARRRTAATCAHLMPGFCDGVLTSRRHVKWAGLNARWVGRRRLLVG